MVFSSVQEIGGARGALGEGLDRVAFCHELIGDGSLLRGQRAACRHDQAAWTAASSAAATAPSAVAAVVQ